MNNRECLVKYDDLKKSGRFYTQDTENRIFCNWQVWTRSVHFLMVKNLILVVI